MNRINKDSSKPEGQGPEEHTHVYMQSVGPERIRQFVIHALNAQILQDVMIGMTPYIMNDYQSLDAISDPISTALTAEGKDGSDGDLVTPKMIDELIRLASLKDEESQKKVKVLREGIGNALCVYRAIAMSLRQVLSLLTAPTMLNQAVGDKLPDQTVRQFAMEISMLSGPHLRGSVVESVQGITPQAMAMTILTAYNEREGIYKIVEQLKTEGSPASLTSAYMIMFANMIASSTLKNFLETFDFKKTGLRQELVEKSRDFIKEAMKAHDKDTNEGTVTE